MLGCVGRAAAELRRAALRAVPAGAARHLPGVLPPVRRRLPGQRPRLASARRLANARSTGRCPATSWGPVRGLLFRPWLLLGGVCFGLAVGTKWAAIYPLAAFGLLVWSGAPARGESFGVRWARLRVGARRRRTGVRPAGRGGRLVYIATWTGWLVHADEYEEHLLPSRSTPRFCRRGRRLRRRDRSSTTASWPTANEKDASGLGEVMQSLRSLWYYHQDVYTFHTHFLNCSEHTTTPRSRRAGCSSTARSGSPPPPTSSPTRPPACDAPEGSDCIRQVLLIGTPMIWWGGASRCCSRS